MNYFLIAIIIVAVILLIVFINRDKINGFNEQDNHVYIISQIKKRTPDFILLDTPEDKSYKLFCKTCKISVDNIMKTGGCLSCNTPNVPLN